MESARNRTPAQLFRNDDALFTAERGVNRLAGTPTPLLYKQIDTQNQSANHIRLPKPSKEQQTFEDVNPNAAAMLVCRQARRRFFIESFHFVESVGLIGCRSSETRRILRRSAERPD